MQVERVAVREGKLQHAQEVVGEAVLGARAHTRAGAGAGASARQPPALAAQRSRNGWDEHLLAKNYELRHHVAVARLVVDRGRPAGFRRLRRRRFALAVAELLHSRRRGGG